MTDDERAIRELVQTWMDASRAGDTAKVLSLMTDDVVFTVPGQEPFGKAEFAAASKAQQGVQVEGTAEIVEQRRHRLLRGNRRNDVARLAVVERAQDHVMRRRRRHSCLHPPALGRVHLRQPHHTLPAPGV